MVEGGAFRATSLEKASREAVFVYQHQTRPDSAGSYRLIAEELMPEEFLHPVYLILRPDGTEADEANRHCHEALSARQIEKMIDGVARDWGKGLSGRDWEEARDALAAAEEQVAAGKVDEARPALEKLAKLRARCGVKDRAVALLDLIDRARKLAGAVAETDPPAAARLASLDLVGAWRLLRKSTADGADAAAEQVLAEIRRFVRLRPVRLDKLLLSTGTLYYLRAEWETDLPAFDGLVLQMGYLTDAPKSFEGFATFDAVEPCRHHRAAFSMRAVDFRLHDVVNARAELWLDGVLVAEERMAKTPAEFPFESESVMVGPDLLTESDTLGSRVKATLRKYELGRYRPSR